MSKQAVIKKTTEKHAGGRPSKFDKIDMDLVKKLAEYGHKDKFIHNFFGVCESTWNNWKQQHPEFLASLKCWKDKADEEVNKALFERAKGYTAIETKVFQYNGEIITQDIEKHYPPDPTAIIFWLKNRQPDMWRDVKSETHNHHLNDNRIQVFQNIHQPEEMEPNDLIGELQSALTTQHGGR